MAFRTERHDDKTLFKNRLWNLMIKKNIDTPLKLAEEICKRNLVKVNLRDNDEVLDEKIINQRIVWSTENKIKKHLNADDTTKLQGEFVTAYCAFFECSADYLFGNIECSTHEKQVCKNLTGLSEDSIDMLIEDKKSFFPFVISTINFLLEKDNYIYDKLELFRLISQYVLTSHNIKSNYEFQVPQMENENIGLCDEYGRPMGFAPINKMPNVFLLSINEILQKLREHISMKQTFSKPPIFKIIDNMLIDLLNMENIRKNIDGFNFDIDNLSVLNRRFKENEKRLFYLYNCKNINDVNLTEFKKEYPCYSDDDIMLLKNTLNLQY